MKDYKKILEGLVNIINNTEKSDIGFANICTFIGENCPELKEYEDERIRKEILNYIDKACIWLIDRSERFVINTPAYYYYDYKQAVEDFKNYMKGE